MKCNKIFFIFTTPLTGDLLLKMLKYLKLSKIFFEFSYVKEIVGS